MENNNAIQKGYQVTTSKHISDVVKGELFLINKKIAVATSDAYRDETLKNREWHFECGNCFFHASDFKDDIVNVVTLEMGECFKLRVPFASVWDGGVVVTTYGVVDIRTGEVTDIESTDVEGLKVYEREYIIMNDVEVNVYTDMNGFRYWADLNNEYM